LLDRLSSSSIVSLPMSSGNVIRLLACRSRFFSFLRVYRLLILAGVMELKEILSVSNRSKSSGESVGISLIMLYYKLISLSDLRLRSCSSLTLLSLRSMLLRF